jgi:hypothetical protein
MGPRVFTSDNFEEFVFMEKKKEKATTRKIEKPDKPKAESFLDYLRPTTGKSEHTRGIGNTKMEKLAMKYKTKKAVAGGIVTVILGALALVGLNMTSTRAPHVQQTARATKESKAPSMLPQFFAPQKARLAEHSNTSTELAKPGKTSTKKSAKLASKSKSKETVKKSVASAKKHKATVKKSKKTLAAKSID